MKIKIVDHRKANSPAVESICQDSYALVKQWFGFVTGEHLMRMLSFGKNKNCQYCEVYLFSIKLWRERKRARRTFKVKW